MPLFLDTGQSAAELNAANCVTIGLVNNMPDAAFDATERQFAGLIREAAPSRVVLLKRFVIPELPRGREMRASLAGKYRDIAELWDTALDGLIVTGTEPRAANMKDEPYWPALSALVDWARENTASTIWSCLAAHAAVLHSDGIVRHRLPQKQFGVFDCRPRIEPSDDAALPRIAMGAAFALQHAAGRRADGRWLQDPHALGHRRHGRCFRQAGRQLLSLFPGPSGIRFAHAVPRISPRRLAVLGR